MGGISEIPLLSLYLLPDVIFLPISGLVGTNMKTRVDKKICPWWNGPCLFEALDDVEVPERDPKCPFRMPIIDKFKDMGTVVMEKVESGTVHEGDSLLVMPNKVIPLFFVMLCLKLVICASSIA
ncbi:hypothetical protein HN51_011931 [Arachis hypogaea]